MELTRFLRHRKEQSEFFVSLRLQINNESFDFFGLAQISNLSARPRVGPKINHKKTKKNNKQKPKKQCNNTKQNIKITKLGHISNIVYAMDLVWMHNLWMYLHGCVPMFVLACAPVSVCMSAV